MARRGSNSAAAGLAVAPLMLSTPAQALTYRWGASPGTTSTYACGGGTCDLTLFNFDLTWSGTAWAFPTTAGGVIQASSSASGGTSYTWGQSPASYSVNTSASGQVASITQNAAPGQSIDLLFDKAPTSNPSTIGISSVSITNTDSRLQTTGFASISPEIQGYAKVPAPFSAPLLAPLMLGVRRRVLRLRRHRNRS
jgi:hypothetical protein